MRHMKFLFILAVVILLLAYADSALAGDSPEYRVKTEYGEMYQVEVTAYCLNGLTAMETQTRPGICAAKREWIGKTAVLYKLVNGRPELFGIYEIQDTGGDQRIKDGKVIDIWLPTYDECKQFGRQNMLVQIIDAKG